MSLSPQARRLAPLLLLLATLAPAGKARAAEGPPASPRPLGEPGSWARPDLARFSDAVVQPTMRELFGNAVRHGFGSYYFFRGYDRYPVEGRIPCRRMDAKYGGGLALLGALAVRVPGAWRPDSGMDDYDDRAAGEVPGALTLEEVQARTLQLVRSVAACHTGNGGSKIGPDDAGENVGHRSTWQTAAKVGVLATAAWLLDEVLAPEERDAVAREGDERRRRRVHGVRLRDVVAGFNLRADGALVNHRRYFPQYQTTIRENLFTAAHWVAAGRGVPRGALHNAAAV